jgi:diaminopimelate decarboxylase
MLVLSPASGTDPDIDALLAARAGDLTIDPLDGLCMELVPLRAIARAHGTPTWVYGAGGIRRRYAALTTALSTRLSRTRVHYAVKANDHLAILSLMRSLGAGADVVSAGEFARARAAGIPPADIVFSGVGKTTAELNIAIAEGVGQINIESRAELDMVSDVAVTLRRTANVVLRVNPDVDAGTHEKITTGRADNKFGIALGDIVPLYARAAALPGVRPVGLAVHIGSQILSPAPYARAYARLVDLVQSLRNAGLEVQRLDLGGGFGIGYGAEEGLDIGGVVNVAERAFAGLGVSLIIEPGRYLVGPAGILLASVILQKEGGEKRFIVADAAMSELIRPALYGAYHGIVPVSPERLDAGRSLADIVGPVCETGDLLGAGRLLPQMMPGDLLAVLDAGAYGAVMASGYNARPRAAAVLIDGGHFSLISRRQTTDELWSHETIPANG